MNPNELYDPGFINALNDYHYLIDKKYPEKGALKLVGDHYKLTADQRSILYRGVSSNNEAEIRKSRIVNDIRSKNLIIDGYNVLFTLLNYRLGRFVFISNDKICRDAGELHGRLRNEKYFNECLLLVFEFLKENTPGSIRFYLDAPVSHSIKHKSMIESELKKIALKGTCNVEKSADHHIKKFKEGIIATSDTAIIDATKNPIADIPRMILERKYMVKLFDINEVLSG